MNGRCPFCDKPFDDHLLPKIQPLGTILPASAKPVCPPKVNA